MPSFETIMSILGWAITGAIAGYIASLLLKTERQGCLVNIILGVVGAFVGGFVVGNLIFPDRGGFTGWGFLDTIINATLGSVLILLLLEIILPGRQIGVRRDDGEGGSRRRGRKGSGGGGIAEILERFLR
jgi:uncharacterized membrane protein YeaQ/YmgE (transglycosylase-associated protein family)